MAAWRRSRMRHWLLSLGAVCMFVMTVIIRHLPVDYHVPSAANIRYLADSHWNGTELGHNRSSNPMQQNSHKCKIPSDLEAQVKVTQRKRRQKIRDMCKSWTPRHNMTTAMLDKILVDDQHKILYCVIPKVGCTNWKRVFVTMSQSYNTTKNTSKLMNVHHEKYMRRHGFRYLSEFSKEEIVRKIQTYYKFMFVRHPLERVLSAYRDKFTQYNKYTRYFQYKYGRHIINKYRDKAKKISLTKGNDVTFEEFVKYLIDLPSRQEEFNPHWVQYYKICHPCKISYDFVGKMESLATDAPYVMNRFQNEACQRSFPPPPKNRAQTGSVVQDFYRSIPTENIKKLIEVYKHDFSLFGYETSLDSLYQRRSAS